MEKSTRHHRLKITLLSYAALIGALMVCAGMVIFEDNINGPVGDARLPQFTDLPLWLSPAIGGPGILLAVVSGGLLERHFARQRWLRRQAQQQHHEGQRL